MYICLLKSPTLLKKIKKSEFLSNSLILITGTFIAQLIPIILQPFLRRIFSPSDFGYFAIFTTIVGVLVLGERFNKMMTLGVVLTSISLVLVNLGLG